MTGLRARPLDETTADTALAGALQAIARLGGGTVESYPEDAVTGW